MKLNNKGWGTTEMILLCCGLFIFLLIAVFFINRFYNSLGKEATSNYMHLETSLANASKEYIDDNNIIVTNSLIINAEDLIANNYINQLKDSKGNICTGYAKIVNNSSIMEYQGFIRCKNYETPNYSK